MWLPVATLQTLLVDAVLAELLDLRTRMETEWAAQTRRLTNLADRLKFMTDVWILVG